PPAVDRSRVIGVYPNRHRTAIPNLTRLTGSPCACRARVAGHLGHPMKAAAGDLERPFKGSGDQQ
ncbi:MAG TPA: hypothetical protein VGP04_02165, partial [Pseudonocardiaceae bacterium]|nr:hypothetical protein [Pseudonocardiaceae bacterium]